MDLVAFELGFFLTGSIDDDAADTVYLAGHFEGHGVGVSEDLAEHFNDVLVGVVVVVKQYDVVARDAYSTLLGGCARFYLFFRRDGGHGICQGADLALCYYCGLAVVVASRHVELEGHGVVVGEVFAEFIVLVGFTRIGFFAFPSGFHQHH